MLGLILGLKAGETMLELLALALPRFLLPLPPFTSAPFLSFRRTPGVEAVMGEPIRDGLAVAEGGIAEAGVWLGPSFGVFLADSRGVFWVD